MQSFILINLVETIRDNCEINKRRDSITEKFLPNELLSECGNELLWIVVLTDPDENDFDQSLDHCQALPDSYALESEFDSLLKIT